MSNSPTRRVFVLGSASVAVTALLTSRSSGNETLKEIMALKPGEYTWHPERAPRGGVAVVVSIPQQRVHVYRNGVRIAVSTCSTGKPGHETPAGVFVVLQKDKHHKSSTYSDAPMPNMNRLTWSGIALHAGKLPGYPASHGCVRLPMAFSEKLFTVTHLGTPVILADAHSDQYELTHPGMVLGSYAASEIDGAVKGLSGKKHPSDWSEAEAYPVVSVIASSRSREIELIKNNTVIAKAPLTIKGSQPIGSNVYVLKSADNGRSGLVWSALSHHSGGSGLTLEADALTRLTATKDFVAALQAEMHPGTMLITTDVPLTPDRRSGQDFVIATTE
jgi:hypothetical protein